MPTLIGIEKFEEKLRDLHLTVRREALVKATRKAAALIRADAAFRAPIDTGRLALGEIAVLRTQQNSADEVTVSVGPENKAFYGLFVEIGTAHSTAEPFLQPAFDAMEDDALRIASAEFLAAINEVIAKGA